MIPARSFGKGGPKIGCLGLGTVKFGRNTGVKYPEGEGFALPSDEEIERILDICADQGVNLLDTAPAYGTSEERLGELLRGRRGNFFISTKVGEEFDGITSRYIFTADHTRMSVERSLKRLKTEVLDCVVVHCQREDLKVLQDTDVVPTLQALKKEGKIRFIGASTYTLAGGFWAVQNLDAVMVSYNPFYRDEEPVIDAAAEKGCAVLIKKGLSSGHMKVDDIKTALRFSVEKRGVTSLVIGSRNPDNILKNILAIKS